MPADLPMVWKVFAAEVGIRDVCKGCNGRQLAAVEIFVRPGLPHGTASGQMTVIPSLANEGVGPVESFDLDDSLFSRVHRLEQSHVFLGAEGPSHVLAIEHVPSHQLKAVAVAVLIGAASVTARVEDALGVLMGIRENVPEAPGVASFFRRQEIEHAMKFG